MRNGQRARVVRAGIAVAMIAGVTAGALAVTAPVAQATPPPAAEAPTVIFTEDFENVGTEPAPASFLDAYVGAEPLSMTYTADDLWIDSDNCNGIIVSDQSPRGTMCDGANYANYARPMARALGEAFVAGDDPTLNQALIDTTVNGPFPHAPAGTTFRTVGAIPLDVEGRFVAFSVDVSAKCGANADPLLTFYLLDGVTEHKVGTDAINACDDPRGSTEPVTGLRVGTYTTDGAFLFSGDDVGIRLDNDQGGASGNDYAVDNIRLLDATPQLSKDFGAQAARGAPSTLTFTITNSTELAAKPGWSFTDSLPAGMTVAATPNAGTTCANAAFSPAAGDDELSVTGDLAAGMASCAVSVDVVAAEGSYANGAGNVTATGLEGPAVDATVDLLDPLAATITTPPNGAIYYPYRDDVPAIFGCTPNAVSCTAVDGNGKVVKAGDDVSAKKPGTYTLTATATDRFGNTSTTTSTYTVAAWVCHEDGLAVLRVPYSTYDFSDAPGSFLELKHAPFTVASGTVHYGVEPLLATVVDPVTGLVGLPLTPYVHATNCIVAYTEDIVVDPITKPVVKSVKKLLKGLLG